MRVSGPSPILGRRVGKEHTVLPRPSGHGPGGATPARMVRAVRAEREPVLDAFARGAAPCRRRFARLPHVRRPSRTIHGPHQNISGAG